MTKALMNASVNCNHVEHNRLISLFPSNPYVGRLLRHAKELGIAFCSSPVNEQWLYHPTHRTIYVWEPDLQRESLSFLVVILAHELGHAVDFELNPKHVSLTRNRHWAEAPAEVEIAAFVYGFKLLKELFIPVSLDAYERMIAPPIAPIVRSTIERFHVCCLLSTHNIDQSRSVHAS